MIKLKILAMLVFVISLTGVVIARADSRTIGFETSEGYSPGSIQGQQGWGGQNPPGIPINPAYDQAVVTNTSAPVSFGGQSWRISNAVTSGSFGDWPFSPSLTNEAGETSAHNGNGVLTFSGGTRQSHFEVQWDFASTTPSSVQVPGCVNSPVPNCLQISTSPDRGDGARMSFIRMKDLPDGLGGLSVEFVDYQDRAPYGAYGSPASAAMGCGAEDDFFLTTVASGLNRAQPHTVRLTMDFVDGPRNDVVKVYVDGTLRHTGTSWEDYYRWCTESGGGTGTTTADQSRTVDSMIFQARSSGGTAPTTLGKGFLIDNLSYLSSSPTPGAKVTGGGTVEDPVFSPTGDLLSLPAIAASANGGSSNASFGSSVSDGATPKGNLVYDDHGANVRIKATSFDSLSISDGTCGTNTHAEFTGTADVIRSTGTTPESLTVKVDDCGEPGTGDQFGIQTNTYCNPVACSGTNTLISGNIQIHKQ